MDFGVLGFDGFVGHESGGGGFHSQVSSLTDATKPMRIGSGFVKKERSGSGEDDWRSSKMAKTDDIPAIKKMPLHQGTPLLRSNPLVSNGGGGGDSHKQEQMLSFSSLKSEVPFLSRDSSFVERSSQNTTFPYYQHIPSAYTRSTGYGSGSLNTSMHVPFAGARGLFTPSQWIELEHQALIYKYITANVPVPSNLLNPLKKSLYPYGLSCSSTGSFPPNTLGWGTFHLGFSGNTDPEPGRCRRTDGKKWRCSRDAVADQKYCERHINRGRHRSRKPVEGQTGHAANGTTNSKVVPMTTSMSTSVIGSGGASNSLAITPQQLKNLKPGVANPSSADALVKRVQDPRGVSMMSSTICTKSNESTFTVSKQEMPFEESSQSEFGFVSLDSLVNPSQRSAFMNSRTYGGSFVDFNDQDTQDQHPLRQFMDDLPKDQSNRSVITWPEELKSDWTRLSMSIPSDFSSSSSSPTQEKLALSPLRLSREFDPNQMDLGVNNELSEPNQKQTNWIPISCGTSVGGPLGEVLTNSTMSVGGCKNLSSLNLLTEGWDGSPQLGSSPTGVLHKAPFGSLSNSSSGSSPRAGRKKTNDGASHCDDVFGSNLIRSSSIPFL
ncbi:WRC domain-containing protein/QLQ domain-containing protein [Cephalotus follicularis]|uniref:Growth-regulating factor n=1 Tax=Cephalotus follicularis TaxID=3775 RepID=A0A1Q3BM05_CEPFO|nr:WRC domain-containing protein/QLQ domain-containing protein [Cephalotus follicularis]